jgi:hypothetical protein
MYTVSDVIVYRDVFSEIIGNIRETGDASNSAISGGNTTITDENTFIDGDIVDIDGTDYKVVSATSSAFIVPGELSDLTTWTALSPYFIDEPIKKLAETLMRKDGKTENFKYQKYPFIALIYDINENRNVQQDYAIATFRFIIGMYTDKNYNSEERIENVFKTRLYPIYQDFLNEIITSGYFDIENNIIPHVKTDRLYWGLTPSTAAKQLGDFVDAIEITNMTLKVLEKQCLP